MIVYVVINEDRHTDTQFEVFANDKHAIDYARSMAKDYCRIERGEVYEEKEIGGCLFVAQYSSEGESFCG